LVVNAFSDNVTIGTPSQFANAKSGVGESGERMLSLTPQAVPQCLTMPISRCLLHCNICLCFDICRMVMLVVEHSEVFSQVRFTAD
jgi:hypothetical protein